jgi:glycerol uptake facilitator-like aquaporin
MLRQIFGEVSGAHMNPLVTIVNVAVGKMGWPRAVVYMVGQLIGGLAGYGFLYVSVPPPPPHVPRISVIVQPPGYQSNPMSH